MRIAETSDLWWKNAVIYCVDVETYYDSDGDGVGDLAGLTQRDRLPRRARGDLPVADAVLPDPRPGRRLRRHGPVRGGTAGSATHGDLVELLRTADDRGIRVIADLVVNHTSAQHPWFEAARRSKDNPYRDYYVWRGRPAAGHLRQGGGSPTRRTASGSGRAQPVSGTSTTSSPPTRPQLRNPGGARPHREVHRVLAGGALGLAGFRVDAVPFLIAGPSTPPATTYRVDPHGYLKELRGFLGRRRGDAILLGEVNLPLQGAAALLRGPRRQRTEHEVRLPRDAEHVPRAGAPGRPAARPDAQQPAEDPS